MGKGRKAKAVTPAPPSKPLPAQGRGGHKRTPTSAFDPAAGQDIYEPEKVVGERQKNLGGGKTETQYEVKWKGWDKKHNTYDPLSNLAGCEDMVSEYKERKRQRDAELGGADARLMQAVQAVDARRLVEVRNDALLLVARRRRRLDGWESRRECSVR